MRRCGVDFERLSAFADGELDLGEELDLRRHLEGCEQCRAIIDTLLRTKEAVASTAEVRPIPHSLRAQVSKLIAENPRKRQVWRWIGPALAAAMILIVIGIYRPMFGSRSNSVERLTEALVEDHVRYLSVTNPIAVSSDDPQQIAQAFADQFGFHIELPNLSGASLLGARLCWLRGHKALLTFYETHSGKFSLFVLDNHAMTGSHPRAECRTSRGYEVCLVSRPAEVLAIVADKPQAQLVMPELKKLSTSAKP